MSREAGRESIHQAELLANFLRARRISISVWSKNQIDDYSFVGHAVDFSQLLATVRFDKIYQDFSVATNEELERRRNMVGLPAAVEQFKDLLVSTRGNFHAAEFGQVHEVLRELGYRSPDIDPTRPRL
jgi:hypothetical protein